jgi:hypothetical protein
MWAQGGTPTWECWYGSPDHLLTPFSLLLLLNIVLCALHLSATIPALSWPTSSMTITDYTARASPASPSTISEGHNASLVRELAGALSFSPVTTALFVLPPLLAASLLVSALHVVPLLSRKTRRISSKTRQLTPLTDTPNSKPRLAYPH